MRMKGRVALVTGAASGIGKDIAETFAREGAKVVIADVSFDAAQAAAADIQKSGGAALAVAMDVTQEQQVDAGVAEAISTFGGLDVLVSNAVDQWRKLLAILRQNSVRSRRFA
jgi:3-hydroxybutyrate dehydrogenase